MLNLSLNSISTQVDEIENPDFTELYKNIAEVYDFFDAEYSRTGNMEKVSETIKHKFNNKVIYETPFIKVSIHTLYVKNEKLESYLMVNTNHEEDIKFGEDYLEGVFDMEDEDSDGFGVINSKLKVVDIEKEIQKRLDIIKQWLLFEEAGYKFFYNRYLGLFPYLHKEIDIRNSKFFPKFTFKHRESGLEKKIENIFESLRIKMENGGLDNEDSDNTLKIESNHKHFIIKINEESICINIYADKLYMGVKNISFEKATKYYEKTSTYIDEIGDIEEEKRKVAKFIKGNKKSLYKLLAGKTVQSFFITSRLIDFIKEYEKLQEKGETIYSPKVIDLLKDIKKEATNDFNPELQTYIRENYANIVDSIVKEKESVFISYYRERLNCLEKGYITLVDVQEIITKLNKFDEKDLMSIDIFDKIIGDMDVKHIQIIIDILGQTKPKFISYFYTQLLKHDSTYDVEIDLEKYKHIYDYNEHISEYEMEVYENIVARVISQHMVANPNYINDLDRLIEDNNISDYISDISAFEIKYITKIHNRTYKYYISEDKKLVGKQDINFSLYSSIDKDNMKDFLTNIIVPHVVYKLHMEDNSELIDQCVSDLEKRSLKEVMGYLGYEDTTCNLLSSISSKEYCDNILKYWHFIFDKKRLKDYTIHGLDAFLKETYNPETTDEKTFINFLMKNESEALSFLENNLSFSNEVGVNLATHSSFDVKKKLLDFPGLTEEMKQAFCYPQQEEVIMLSLLSFGNTSAEIDMLIAKHSSLKVRKKLASYGDRLDIEVQKILAVDEEEEVVLKFLKVGLPDEIDILIAKHPSIKVRKELAGYGNRLHIEVQKILAVDEEEEVVLKFFQGGLPDEIDMLIAKHPSIKVRKELASYGDGLHIEVQKILAADQEEEIVMKFLQVGLADEVDILIAKHPSSKVRKELASYGTSLNIEVQKILAQDEEEVVLSLLQPGLPDEIDMLIAKHPSSKVRKELASYGTDLNIEVQKVLAQDDEEEVVLKFLKLGLEDKIDMLIAKHPSSKVKKELASYGDGLNIEVKRILFKDQDKEVGKVLYNAVEDYHDFHIHIGKWLE